MNTWWMSGIGRAMCSAALPGRAVDSASGGRGQHWAARSSSNRLSPRRLSAPRVSIRVRACWYGAPTSPRRWARSINASSSPSAMTRARCVRAAAIGFPEQTCLASVQCCAASGSAARTAASARSADRHWLSSGAYHPDCPRFSIYQPGQGAVWPVLVQQHDRLAQFAVPSCVGRLGTLDAADLGHDAQPALTLRVPAEQSIGHCDGTWSDGSARGGARRRPAAIQSSRNSSPAVTACCRHRGSVGSARLASITAAALCALWRAGRWSGDRARAGDPRGYRCAVRP